MSAAASTARLLTTVTTAINNNRRQQHRRCCPRHIFSRRRCTSGTARGPRPTILLIAAFALLLSLSPLPPTRTLGVVVGSSASSSSTFSSSKKGQQQRRRRNVEENDASECLIFYEWSNPSVGIINDESFLGAMENDLDGDDSNNDKNGNKRIGVFDTPLYTTLDDLMKSRNNKYSFRLAGRVVGAYQSVSSTPLTTVQKVIEGIEGESIEEEKKDGEERQSQQMNATNDYFGSNETDDGLDEEDDEEEYVFYYAGHWNFHLYDRGWISSSYGFSSASLGRERYSIPNVVLGGTGEFAGYAGTVKRRLLGRNNNNKQRERDRRRQLRHGERELLWAPNILAYEWTVCPQQPAVQPDNKKEDCAEIWERDKSTPSVVVAGNGGDQNEKTISFFAGDDYSAGEYAGGLDNPLFRSLDDVENETNLIGRNVGSYFVDNLLNKTTAALFNFQLKGGGNDDWIAVSFGWSLDRLSATPSAVMDGQEEQPNVILGGTGRYAGIQGTIEDIVEKEELSEKIELNNDDADGAANDEQIHRYRICPATKPEPPGKSERQRETFLTCTEIYVLQEPNPVSIAVHDNNNAVGEGESLGFSHRRFAGSALQSTRPYVELFDFPFFTSERDAQAAYDLYYSSAADDAQGAEVYWEEADDDANRGNEANGNITATVVVAAGRLTGTNISGTGGLTTTELSNFHFFPSRDIGTSGGSGGWLTGILGSSVRETLDYYIGYEPPEIATGGTGNWTGFVGLIRSERVSLSENVTTTNIVRYAICPEIPLRDIAYDDDWCTWCVGGEKYVHPLENNNGDDASILSSSTPSVKTRRPIWILGGRVCCSSFMVVAALGILLIIV